MRSEKDSSGRPPEGQDGKPASNGSGAAVPYTPGDRELFAQLSDFSFARPGWMAATAEADPPPSSAAYSARDLQAFDSLLPGRSSRQRAAAPTLSRPYSESDHRLFEDLMAFDKRRTAAAAPDSSGAASAFQYAPEDLVAFERLSPDGPEDRRDIAASGAAPAGRRDKDVGHIKIVDFDKERSRQKESRRRGSMNIKIRYFD